LCNFWSIFGAIFATLLEFFWRQFCIIFKPCFDHLCYNFWTLCDPVWIVCGTIVWLFSNHFGPYE
jgi:hypothetical protein